jgi:mono/diheme cytochrome c family protein
MVPVTPTTSSNPQPNTNPNTNTPSMPDVTIPPAPSAGNGCEATTIVGKHCTSCHGATPMFGAPMSLMTQADFQKTSIGDPKMTVAQMARSRINATDNKRMPPASMPALTPAEIDTLNKWIDSGATVGTTCAPTMAPNTNPMTMTGNPGNKPDPTLDPSVKCYTFNAHGATKNDPFKVGVAKDAYYNFTFNAPWTGTQYAKAFRTKTDNLKVIHHWLLFKEGAPVQDGAQAVPSSGTHPSGQLVHGWAPGGEDLILNDEVGMELPATGFTLELHYNSNDANALDKSGVEVCVTPNKPKNIAGISWLGTDAIGGTTATGTCNPDTGMPIRILGGTPHMHVAGTHMKVEILRQGGKVEILHDAPFDFNYQRAYDYQNMNLMLMPGDQVRTTCTYNKPVTFGEGTGDEMCYFFTLHYPVNALTSAGLGQVIHGQNTCGVL